MKLMTQQQRFLSLAFFYGIALTGLVVCLALLNWQPLSLSTPRFDEIAMRAAVFAPWTEWFTRGFSDYFVPYPEFAETITNFIRPIVNILYWISYQLGLSMPAQLLALNYVCHALNVLIIFFAARQHTLLDRLALGSIAFFAPAFWIYPVPNFPAFGTEIFLGTCVALSVLAIASNRLTLGIACLAIAVFTKEMALPVAAGVIVFAILVKKIRLAGFAALVLISYFALRYYNFNSLTGGVYATPSIHIITLAIPRLITFPLSYIKGTDLRALLHNPSFSLHIIYFSINALIGGLLAFLLIIKRKAVLDFFKFQAERWSEEQKGHALIWLSFFASLLFFVAIAITPRFSYSTLILFLLALSRHEREGVRRPIILFLIIGSGIGFFQTYNANANRHPINMVINKAAEILVARLPSLPPSIPIYILNDISTGYSKASDLAMLAGAQIDLRRGNSINVQECQVDDLNEFSVSVLRNSAKTFQISTALPNCAVFTFESASIAKLKLTDRPNWVERNQQVLYGYEKDGSMVSFSDRFNNQSNAPFKLMMHVENAAILYFDFKRLDWILLQPQ